MKPPMGVVPLFYCLHCDVEFRFGLVYVLHQWNWVWVQFVLAGFGYFPISSINQ